MGDLTIDPAPGLVTGADPRSGQKSQFALFSDHWLELQGFVGSALELPITKGDFEAKYGSFSSSGTIDGCIKAMEGVQNTAQEFGNPKTLRAALIQNPNILASKTAPTEIYTHTVWLGQKVHTTAATLASGFDSVLTELTGLPAKEQVENIKAYLFDQEMGPIPLGKTMSDEVGALIKKLGVFEGKMHDYNEKFKAYTGKSSDMIRDVDQSIGALSQKIKDLERSRDDAYKAWRDFTIAACVSSVGCFLIGAVLAPFTGGASLLVGGAAAIGTGVGLGVKAAKCRAEYNQYCKDLDEQTVELKKKQRLRSDLGDFDKAMMNVGPAMANFLKSLQTIEGVWVQMNTDMLAINNSITESNVGSTPFLVKAKAKNAIESWKQIDEAAKQFTVESLVDYTSLAFGDTMPEKAAA